MEHRNHTHLGSKEGKLKKSWFETLGIKKELFSTEGIQGFTFVKGGHETADCGISELYADLSEVWPTIVE